MAGTSLTWRLTRDMGAQWSQRLHSRVVTETEAYAESVLTEAQSTVQVRTGATRDSGTVQQTGDDPLKYAVIFMGAALYLEYGTARSPAHPFLRPAAMAMLSQYLNRLAQTTQGRVKSSGMSMDLSGMGGGSG